MENENTMKKIRSLGEKECICCTTQQECDIIMDMIHDAGLTWHFGLSYGSTRMDYKEPGVCFVPKEGCYNKIEYLKEKGYTIYPASDFIEVKRQPKQGERVLVRNREVNEWNERIFLCEIPQSNIPYLCVPTGQESDYLEGKKVAFQRWTLIKQLPTTSTYTIECTPDMYEKVKDLISK